MKCGDHSVLPVSCKNLPVHFLAVLLAILFLPVADINADALDDCLLATMKKAEGSTTVDQLRRQCQDPGAAMPVRQMPDGAAVEAAADDKGPAEIVLKTPQALKPAFFPHKKHQNKYICGTCHHKEKTYGTIVKYQTGDSVGRCVDCHNADMPNKELNSLKLVGHKLCRECHRKNQNITSAKCSTCHRKDL